MPGIAIHHCTVQWGSLVAKLSGDLPSPLVQHLAKGHIPRELAGTLQQTQSHSMYKKLPSCEVLQTFSTGNTDFFQHFPATTDLIPSASSQGDLQLTRMGSLAVSCHQLEEANSLQHASCSIRTTAAQHSEPGHSCTLRRHS